jgi:tetratricopeptide (TPR) repeat protein
MGWYHFKKGEYAEALKILEKARGLLKLPDPEVLDHLAQTLWKLGQHDKAIALLEDAAKQPLASPAVAKRLATFKLRRPAPPPQK